MEAKTNYEMWNIVPLTKSVYDSLSFEQQLKYLCHLAHLAPSSHNIQPSKFFIDTEKKQLDIYLDTKRILPASDVAGRQAVISMGCALAHIDIASTYYGTIANTTLHPHEKKTFLPKDNAPYPYIHIATISFSEGTGDDSLEPLVHAIPKRKVMRADYDEHIPIPEDVLTAVQQVPEAPVVQLHMVTDPIRRMSIAEFQAQADGFVINSKKFSRELGAWLLPNDTTSPIGMPGFGFGLQDDQSIRLHEALLGKRSMEPEDGLRFSLAGKHGMEKSPFIGFLSVEKDTPTHWIETGKTMEHMFLLFTAAGIQTAVHAGIVEVALINRMFAASLGTTRRISALFRAGYIKNKKDLERPHAPRLPLQDILFNEKP